MTPRQVRAARALLGWDQIKLADEAVVALSAAQRLEQGKPVRTETAERVRKALQAAGIQFVGGASEGVNLRL